MLYRWPPPISPEDTWCAYRAGASRMTEIADRYNKSIAERVTPPPTLPDVSVTLENRLESSFCRVPHVWTAHVQNSTSPDTSTATTYPTLLTAKIFDPIFIDSGDAEYADPFSLRDLSVSREVDAYRRLEPLQGTRVPRFYGHFIAPLPSQHNRTVNVILMEYVQGTDLRILVPLEVAETVCSVHKDAVIDAALDYFFEILALGVSLSDMQPRNVVLRHQEHGTGKPHCTTANCPLRLEVDCEDLHMVMVDFEMVEFIEPDPNFNEPLIRRQHIDRVKPVYLTRWLESRMP